MFIFSKIIVVTKPPSIPPICPEREIEGIATEIKNINKTLVAICLDNYKYLYKESLTLKVNQ